jgi:hypothetical protein
MTSPAVSAISFSGTMSGSLSGTQLSLTYIGRPAGVSGVPDCTASASGAAAVDNTGISGRLDAMFSSCEGLDLQPPADDQVTLVRQ